MDTNVSEKYLASIFREEMSQNWGRWRRGRNQSGPIGMIHSATNKSQPKHFLPENP
jgi:hypothetical protein